MITGSSMEPLLRGPRFLWTCPNCSETNEFALNSCRNNQPFRCIACNKLDTNSVIDFDDLENLGTKTIPGYLVKFATLRSIRATRTVSIASGLTHPSGLVRGDIVVFQETPEAKREIKRVIGFPYEHIAIAQGDIFVDQVRWCKSLEQSLRQAILVNAWDGVQKATRPGNEDRSNGLWNCLGREFYGVLGTNDPENTSIESTKELTFEYEFPRCIDNRNVVNAHDSHVIVPVNDFGFACQLSGLDLMWKIRCCLCSPNSQSIAEMELQGNELTIQSGDQVAKVEMNRGEDKSIWIVLAMVDGHLIIGSQEKEWLRSALPQIATDDTFHGLPPRNAPIAIGVISGKLAIDQLLVFRDIYYRGNGDSDHQVWAPANQMIVLGDNVSLSSDARDRWPDGLAPNSIKGVVIQTDSPMEALLRQR